MDKWQGWWHGARPSHDLYTIVSYLVLSKSTSHSAHQFRGAQVTRTQEEKTAGRISRTSRQCRGANQSAQQCKHFCHGSCWHQRLLGDWDMRALHGVYSACSNAASLDSRPNELLNRKCIAINKSEKVRLPNLTARCMYAPIAPPSEGKTDCTVTKL